MAQRPPLCGYLAATGHGEVWDHTDEKKFKQFGWRCTTNETGYVNDTLIGNWTEERSDTRKLAESKPIPSQVRVRQSYELASTIFGHSEPSVR